MKNRELFETVKHLIDVSPNSARKIVESIINDINCYDAILYDPSYFCHIFDEYITIDVMLDVGTPANLTKIKDYDEEELTIIFDTLMYMLKTKLKTNQYRNVLNNIFAEISPTIDKFKIFYKYVEDTDYVICRNDTLEAILYTIKDKRLHHLDVYHLIYNDHVTYENYKFLIKEYGKMLIDPRPNSWSGYTFLDGATEINTETLRKLVETQTNLNKATSINQSHVLARIVKDCDLETVITYIDKMCISSIITNRTGGFATYSYSWSPELFDLFARIPRLIEYYKNNTSVLEIINSQNFNLEQMYAFITKDEWRAAISQAIIDRINANDSKIAISLRYGEQAIIDYIQIFGRRTNLIYSSEINNYPEIFRICTENNIKLSKSSSIFDYERKSAELPKSFLAAVNDTCETYGCNSRVIIEFAKDNELVLNLYEEKIESEELVTRYHKYLVQEAL